MLVKNDLESQIYRGNSSPEMFFYVIYILRHLHNISILIVKQQQQQQQILLSQPVMLHRWQKTCQIQSIKYGEKMWRFARWIYILRLIMLFIAASVLEYDEYKMERNSASNRRMSRAWCGALSQRTFWCDGTSLNSFDMLHSFIYQLFLWVDVCGVVVCVCVLFLSIFEYHRQFCFTVRVIGLLIVVIVLWHSFRRQRQIGNRNVCCLRIFASL